MDPITCCLLGICCPPASAEQLEALIKVLVQGGTDEEKAKTVAKATQKQLVAFTQKLKDAMKA